MRPIDFGVSQKWLLMGGKKRTRFQEEHFLDTDIHKEGNGSVIICEEENRLVLLKIS